MAPTITLPLILDKSGFNFNFLTKNEKLNQNKLIAYILELLKIINDKNNQDVSPYVLKGIFIELLNLDKICICDRLAPISFKVDKKYTYDKTNKFYDKEWVKSNFCDEFYKKVDTDAYTKIIHENAWGGYDDYSWCDNDCL